MNDRNAKLASLKDELGKEGMIPWGWTLVAFLLTAACATVAVRCSEDIPLGVVLFFSANILFAVSTAQRDNKKYIGAILDELINEEQDPKD